MEAAGDEHPQRAAQRCQSALDRYFALCRSLVIETNPQGVKYALSLMGKCEPHLRLPLLEPQASTKKQIHEALVLARVPLQKEEQN